MAWQRRKPPSVGIKAHFPGFIPPALATSIERVPTGDRWIHEIKFDGYRVQLHIANEGVRIFTRNGHDWTNRFKKVHPGRTVTTWVTAGRLQNRNGHASCARKA